jgi:hypothetical protein
MNLTCSSGFIDCGSSSQGISLTKEAFQFWVITGTTSARKLSTDVALAAIYSNCCYFDGHE